ALVARVRPERAAPLARRPHDPIPALGRDPDTVGRDAGLARLSRSPPDPRARRQPTLPARLHRRHPGAAGADHGRGIGAARGVACDPERAGLLDPAAGERPLLPGGHLDGTGAAPAVPHLRERTL
ncbi:MAG: hypothetical protein AVDCRST_MAG88-4536, partial [uncultured Thermomicrobiales bacterium]